MQFNEGVWGGKRNKRLNFGSDLDHDPASVEVLHSQVSQNNITVSIFGDERVFSLDSKTDKNKILQRVSDPMALVEVSSASSLICV